MNEEDNLSGFKGIGTALLLSLTLLAVFVAVYHAFGT